MWMRILMATLVFLLMAASTLGQQPEWKMDLWNHPAFTSEEVLKNFGSGLWRMRRMEFQKKAGEITCRNEWLSVEHGLLPNNDGYCQAAIKDHEKVAEIHIVRISILLYDDALKEIFRVATENEPLIIPEANKILVGYRRGNDYIESTLTSDSNVNRILSEIYSLSLGRTTSLLGNPIPQR